MSALRVNRFVLVDCGDIFGFTKECFDRSSLVGFILIRKAHNMFVTHVQININWIGFVFCDTADASVKQRLP